MRTDGQTDRQTEGWTDMELIITFLNFANAPKSRLKILQFVVTGHTLL